MKHLIAIAILVSGCGKGLQTATPGIEFEGFDPATERVVRAAADDLFARVPLSRHVSVQAVHNGGQGATEGGRACVNCPNCWIEINVDRGTESELRGAVWHEYGHCAGLSHTKEHGVMYPTNYGLDSLWPEEVEAFVAAVLAEEK